ncbi:SMI1/KNR4 family protein [Amycolatopsis samaneae]|uniref:SMI1/KNR4 family protein n=1 Tax=Amycolatopsis samaneae TaxID=664691 RepID=A0ABW5GRW2_9PSEU
MRSGGPGISRYRLFRRPAAAEEGWVTAGLLTVGVERSGVDGVLTEIGWRTGDGAESSLVLTGLLGSHRAPDGETWELRAEPVPGGTDGPALPAAYLVFEGDNARPLSQHPDNPLRLLLDDGAGHPVRLSWRFSGGEGGYAAFAPSLQDSQLAKVVDIQATAEHPDAGEVAANLVDGSAATKWFAPVPRAELALRLSAERTVLRYELDSADDAPDRDPRDWQLLGLDDDGWVVLDERGGERFDGRFTSRTFTVARPRACERYRLRITGNAGSPHLQLGALRLHTLEGPEPPPSFLGWYHRPGEAAVTLRGFLVGRERPAKAPVPEDDVPETAPASPRWPEWLTGYTEQWFGTASEDDLEAAGLPETGLTRPPATDAAIEECETRLGHRLPPSLRSFYRATDGLLQAGPFGERVLRVAELDWMRVKDAELLDAWGVFAGGDEPDELSELLLRALRIGESEDGDRWFLDPADHTGGEWAAYTWHPADGSDPTRHDGFPALLEDERATLERLRAHEGRPAHPEAAEELLAEGRRRALAGDVAAAHEILNRAMDAGSAPAAYLDAQVRLFAFPHDWHEGTLRNGVLGNDHVLAAIDDEHLRGDLVPMYLALTLPDHLRPTAGLAKALTRYATRIGELPGRPPSESDRYDAEWEAFAATLVGDPVPDPGPFDRACATARELVRLGRPGEAWDVLRDALPSWRPDSPMRVMPTVLISDPVLRTIMTAERRLVAAVTPRSA